MTTRTPARGGPRRGPSRLIAGGRAIADLGGDDDEPGARMARLFAAIYAVARRIPRGRITTYGQLAELAGMPGASRVAGAAMKVSKPGDRLPWQRVVGKRGRYGQIAILDPVGAAIQRQLLEDEGVEVSERGQIALDRYGWLPGERRAASKRGR